MQQFSTKGLIKEELSELLALVPIHAPYLTSTLEYLSSNITVRAKAACPDDWKDFILAISKPSPVCALLHPSDKLFDLLAQIAKTGPPGDFSTLQYLQHQCPVLFNLLRTANPPQAILAVVLPELITRAKAPFQELPFSSPVNSLPPDIDEMEYFPSLPKLRARNIYLADRRKGAQESCTKYSTRHPSLLPGVFTLFCQHGKLLL